MSVWLFLLMLAAFFAASVVGAWRLLMVLISHGAEPGGEVPVAFLMAWRVALLAGTGALIFGVIQRRRWGRWIGIAGMIAIALFSIFGQDPTHYASDAERLGGAIGRLGLMPSLMVWWGYAFGFSSKAKRYFA